MSANTVRKPQIEQVATEKLGDNELVERVPGRGDAPVPGARRAIPEPHAELHLADDRRPRARRGPRAGGVHPRVPAPAPLRPVQEVLDLDLHDRDQPGEERAAQPLAEPAGALPDDARRTGRTTTGRSSWRTTRTRPTTCSGSGTCRSWSSARSRRAARASPRRVRAARDRGQDVRGDRRDHAIRNLGTVKSRLNRARNRFAQIIAPLAGLAGDT